MRSKSGLVHLGDNVKAVEDVEGLRAFSRMTLRSGSHMSEQTEGDWLQHESA
jgi:hypothetical protein